MKIYWANSFFSEADKRFNRASVRQLRRADHEVFSPQETRANRTRNPRAEDIFKSDADAIRGCDVLVACIDQEPVDSGVACEIGYAVALGIPVVGLLTDSRWHRVGEGHIYKNLFVLGCIRASGAMVSSVSDLITHLTKTE